MSMNCSSSPGGGDLKESPFEMETGPQGGEGFLQGVGGEVEGEAGPSPPVVPTVSRASLSSSHLFTSPHVALKIWPPVEMLHLFAFISASCGCCNKLPQM